MSRFVDLKSYKTWALIFAIFTAAYWFASLATADYSAEPKSETQTHIDADREPSSDFCEVARTPSAMHACAEYDEANHLNRTHGSSPQIGSFRVGEVFVFTEGRGSNVWVHETDYRMVGGNTCQTSDGLYKVIAFADDQKRALLAMIDDKRGYQAGGTVCSFNRTFFVPIEQLSLLDPIN